MRKVAYYRGCLASLSAKGVPTERGPESGKKGRWALVRDPDGHSVVLTEFD